MNRIIFGLFALTVPFPLFAGPSAQDVMSKNEDARKIETVYSNATLTTGGPDMAEKVKKFTWWRKLTSDHVHFFTLTRFKSPAEIAGEGILFLEREGDENEVLMYLPNFKKIRRVESQQQSGSFMGSELSYADIATPHFSDYSYRLLKEETCPGEGNAQLKCFVIESLPVSESVTERTGYQKSVHWIRPDNFMGVQIENYNLDGELSKRTEASEIHLVDSKNKKWMADKVRIENLKNKKFTLLQFRDVKANEGIPDSIFTQQNLSRGQ